MYVVVVEQYYIQNVEYVRKSIRINIVKTKIIYVSMTKDKDERAVNKTASFGVEEVL